MLASAFRRALDAEDAEKGIVRSADDELTLDGLADAPAPTAPAVAASAPVTASEPKTASSKLKGAKLFRNVVQQVLDSKDETLVLTMKREEVGIKKLRVKLSQVQADLDEERKTSQKLRDNLREQQEEQDSISNLLKTTQVQLAAITGGKVDLTAEMQIDQMREYYEKKIKTLNIQLTKQRDKQRSGLNVVLTKLRSFKKEQRDTVTLAKTMGPTMREVAADCEKALAEFMAANPCGKSHVNDHVIENLEEAIDATVQALMETLESGSWELEPYTEMTLLDADGEDVTEVDVKISSMMHKLPQVSDKFQEQLLGIQNQLTAALEANETAMERIGQLENELEASKDLAKETQEKLEVVEAERDEIAREYQEFKDSIPPPPIVEDAYTQTRLFQLAETGVNTDEKVLETKNVGTEDEPIQAAYCYDCCEHDFPKTCLKCKEDLPYGPGFAAQIQIQENLQELQENLKEEEAVVEEMKELTEPKPKKKKVALGDKPFVEAFERWMAKRKELLEKRRLLLESCFYCIKTCQVNAVVRPPTIKPHAQAHSDRVPPKRSAPEKSKLLVSNPMYQLAYAAQYNPHSPGAPGSLPFFRPAPPLIDGTPYSIIQNGEHPFRSPLRDKSPMRGRSPSPYKTRGRGYSSRPVPHLADFFADPDRDSRDRLNPDRDPRDRLAEAGPQVVHRSPPRLAADGSVEPATTYVPHPAGHPFTYSVMTYNAAADGPKQESAPPAPLGTWPPPGHPATQVPNISSPRSLLRGRHSGMFGDAEEGQGPGPRERHSNLTIQSVLSMSNPFDIPPSSGFNLLGSMYQKAPRPPRSPPGPPGSSPRAPDSRGLPPLQETPL